VTARDGALCTSCIRSELELVLVVRVVSLVRCGSPRCTDSPGGEKCIESGSRSDQWTFIPAHRLNPYAALKIVTYKVYLRTPHFAWDLCSPFAFPSPHPSASPSASASASPTPSPLCLCSYCLPKPRVPSLISVSLVYPNHPCRYRPALDDANPASPPARMLSSPSSPPPESPSAFPPFHNFFLFGTHTLPSHEQADSSVPASSRIPHSATPQFSQIRS
jgi:hypothetical protein